MNILPEEDITGFLVRQSFDSSRLEIFMKPETRSNTRNRPGWIYPSGLKALALKFSVGLPSANEILNRHTRFPLFASFLSTEQCDILRRHHLSTAMQGVAPHVGMTTPQLRGRMAVCIECLQEDLGSFGYATWRRSHLMPGIFACSIHQRPLQTFCDTCEAGHRHQQSNWRPNTLCICGGSLKEVERMTSVELASAIGISDTAKAIMEGSTSALISTSAVTTAIRHRLGRELTKQALDSQLRDALIRSIGKKGLIRLGIAKGTISRLTGRILSYGPIRNPIQNLAALQAVFGGVKEIEMAFREISEQAKIKILKFTIEEEKIAKRKKERFLKDHIYMERTDALPQRDQLALNQRFRKWASDLKVERPTLRRGEIYKCKGAKSASRYFRCYDTEWYNEIFPNSKSVYTDCVDFRAKHIESILSHIEKRYELSILNQPQKKITKTYLLANTGHYFIQAKFFDDIEVKAQIAKYIDTTESLRRRNIEIVCREIRQRCSLQPLGDLASYSNRSYNGTKTRLYKARLWLSKHP